MDAPRYTPDQIADWFLCNIDADAGDSLTHLKLQKLVYYAQAWSLAIFNRPLFAEDFEAWVHGPALYSLYQKYTDYSWGALPEPDNCPAIEKNVADLMRDILELYGTLPAKKLEALTHSEFPWIEARAGIPPDARSSAKINKETMRHFYLQELEAAKNRAEVS